MQLCSGIIENSLDTVLNNVKRNAGQNIVDTLLVSDQGFVLFPASPHGYNYLIEMVLFQKIMDRGLMVYDSSTADIPFSRFEYRIRDFDIVYKSLKKRYLFQSGKVERRARITVGCRLILSDNRVGQQFVIYGEAFDTLSYAQAEAAMDDPALIKQEKLPGQENPLWEGVITLITLVAVLYLFYIDKEGN